MAQDVELTEEEVEVIVDAVEEIDIEELDAEEAEELVEDLVEVLVAEEVTVEVLENLVDNDNFDAVQGEAITAIAVAIDEADDDVKEVFEESVDIFGGDTEDYTPSGSRVTVEERRLLVAVSASTIAVSGAPSASSGSAPSGPTRGNNRAKGNR